MAASAPLSKGTKCHYLTRQGEWVTVTVKAVHVEESPPFYTIDMGADRDERQTVREKLFPLAEYPNGPPSRPETTAPAEAAAAAASQRQAPLPPSRDFSVRTTAALRILAERSPDAHALFKRIDRDGNGFITVKNLMAFFESADDRFAKRLLKAIDVDDDGLIDVHEFRAAHAWAVETKAAQRLFFSGLKNILVTVPEGYVAGQHMTVAHDGVNHTVEVPPSVPPGGSFEVEVPVFAGATPGEIHRRIDTTGNGKISLPELEEYLSTYYSNGAATAGDAKRLFSSLDSDESGLVDAAEFKRACQRARA